MNPLNIFRKTRNTALDVQEGAWLADQTRKYPYFSLLHIVAAKNAQQKKNSDAETLRTIAALYAQDRKRFAGYIEERYNFSMSSVEALFASETKTALPKPKAEEPKAAPKPADKPAAAAPKAEAPKSAAPAPTPVAKPADKPTEPKTEAKAETKPAVTPALKAEPIKAAAPSVTPAPAKPASTTMGVGNVDIGLQTRIGVRSSMIQTVAKTITQEIKQEAKPGKTAAEHPKAQAAAPVATAKAEPAPATPEAKPAAKAAEPAPVAKAAPKTEPPPAAPLSKAAPAIDVKPAAQTESPKAETAKAEAPKAEATKIEPAKTESAAAKPAPMPAPIKVEPIRAEDKKPPAAPAGGRVVYTREDKPETAARDQAAAGSVEPAAKGTPARGTGARPGLPLNPMNAPEGDNPESSFESLRRSLLQLIQSQIGDEEAAKPTAKTGTNAPVVPDPVAAKPAAPAKSVSADPDPVQQELQQLDTLRSRLQEMQVMPGAEKPAEQPAKAAPQPEHAKPVAAQAAAPIEVKPVAPKPAPAAEKVVAEKTTEKTEKETDKPTKKDRSGPLMGTHEMNRFVPLAPEATAPAPTASAEKLTSPSMQRFVQPDFGGGTSQAKPATTQAQPAAQTGTGKPATEATAKTTVPSAPNAGGTESFKRFVEPKFETAPDTLKVEIQAAEAPAKAEAPKPTIQAEAPKPAEPKAKTPAPPASEGTFAGENSMRRFKDLTFDAPPAATAKTEALQPKAAAEKPLAEKPVAEKPVADKPVAKAADAAEGTTDGERSMSRFVMPEFYQKPATLHLPREPKTKAEAAPPAAPVAKAEPVARPAAEKAPAKPAEDKPAAPKATAEKPATPSEGGSSSFRRFVDLSATQEAVQSQRGGQPTAAKAEAETPAPKTKQEPTAAAATPKPKSATTGKETDAGASAFSRFVMPNFAPSPHLSIQGGSEVPTAPAPQPVEAKKPAPPATEKPAAQQPAQPSVAKEKEAPAAERTGRESMGKVKATKDLAQVTGTAEGTDAAAKAPNSFEYQHRDIEVEIVLKPEQLKYFKEDPSKLHAKQAPQPEAQKPTEKATPVSAKDEALKGLLEQEAFLKVERAFERETESKPAAKQPPVPATPEIDSSLPEQLEEIRQTAAGAAIAAPVVTPLEPNPATGDFAERMNTFRENLQRIRAKGMPASPEVNIKKIQRKFLDRIVQSMSSSSTVSIEAGQAVDLAPQTKGATGAPLSESAVLEQLPPAPAFVPKSNIDTLIDRFGKLETVIAGNLAANRSELESAARAEKGEAAEKPPTPPANADDEISETQAQVYILQGQPFKALRIYEKLSLKFPEKSGYFASLIQNLEI